MRRAVRPAWRPVAAPPVAGPVVPVMAVVAVAVALAIGLARARAASATTRSGGQGDGPVSTAEVQRTYLADCAVCHGSDGRGTANGPPVAGVGRASVDYYLSTGRMPLEAQVGRDPVSRTERPQPDVQIQDATVTPHRHQPAYPPAMIAGLVEYVHGFASGGPDIPDVAPDPAQRARGGEIYRLQCAACHAWSGDGGALYQREAPSLHRATPQQIAEAVRVGPGAMPGFGEAAIPRADLDALVAYVQELDHPDDRGGQSLWHLGPVAEGGVAILVGLALLVLTTRMIGDRS